MNVDSRIEIFIKNLKKKIVAVVGMTVGLSDRNFYEKIQKKQIVADGRFMNWRVLWKHSNKKQIGSVVGMTVGLSDGNFYENIKEKTNCGCSEIMVGFWISYFYENVQTQNKLGLWLELLSDSRMAISMKKCRKNKLWL